MTMTHFKNEGTLLWYSLRMLVGRNLLAVGIISLVTLGAVFTAPVSARVTRLLILLRQLEMFAPLLGIVIFSDLIADDVQAKRAVLLMSSRSGMVPVIVRKLVHGLLITSTAILLTLLTLRLTYTSFAILPAFLIVIPGALYFGMIGLLAATFAANALVGYAAGAGVMILSMVVKQAMPLIPLAYQLQGDLATGTLFAEHNWLFVKIVFVLLAVALALLVVAMAKFRDRRKRIAVATLCLLTGCYGVIHTQWARPVLPDVYFTAPGVQLDAIQADDTLIVRSAAVCAWGRGHHKTNEEASITDTVYERDQGQWRERQQVEYDPAGEFDLVHLDIEANVDPETAAFDVRARADIEVLAQGVQKLYLRIAWELQVTQIRIQDSAAPFSRHGDLIIIPLSEAADRGETLAVELTYTGALRLPSARQKSERKDKHTLFVNSRWYPFVKSWYHEGLVETCSFDTRITVPRGWVVGAGERIDMSEATETFRFGTDTPCDRIGLLITRLPHSQKQIGDITVTVFGRSLGEALRRDIADEACNALAYYESAFGKYPHRHLSIVEYGHIGAGGVAVPSHVLLNPERCRAEHRNGVLEFLVPHEIAHQWFSSALPNWIAEASAVYSNYLYLAQQPDNHEKLAHFHKSLRDIFEPDKHIPAPLLDGRGSVVYTRGGYLLMMLTSIRKQDTIDALGAFIQDQLQRQLSDPEPMNDRFIAAMMAAGGSEWATFVADWIRSTKKFDPAVTGLRQSEDGEGYRVTASLAHHEPIRFPVPLRLTFTDGSQADRTWNATTDQQTVTWSFDRPVQSILLDPENVLLDWNRRNNLRRIDLPHAAPTTNVVAEAPARLLNDHWTAYTVGDGLLGNQVQALTLDPQGRVWATLHLYSKKPGTYVQCFDGSWAQPDTLSAASGPVYAVAVQPNGTVWTAGTGRIRRIRDGQTTLFFTTQTHSTPHWSLDDPRLMPNPQANSNIPGCVVYDLSTDRQGRIWLATDSGITVIDDDAEVLQHMTVEDGLPGNHVFCMARQDDQTLWAGTDRGCASYRDGRWQPQDGCPEGIVTCMAMGRRGTVYAGTYRYGLYAFDGQNATRYRSSNSSLPHDMITALVCDKQQRVWVGTGLGLWCMDSTGDRAYNSQNSGLLSDNIADLAVEGQALWVATDAGIARYDLDADSASQLACDR